MIVRGAFEEAVKQVVPVRGVRLRDSTQRWLAREETSLVAAERVLLDVPGRQATLEASFDAGYAAGDWDFQALGLCAQIAALVLEIERTRTIADRASAGSSASAAKKPQRDRSAPIIGSTTAIRTLRTTIERVANTDFTVLLEGESGVGKELVARQIHELSRRRQGPFVAINCAAIVETLVEAELFGIEDRTATGVRGRRGKFEHADGGTLFLDEVSDLSLAAQAKLLRALQDLAVERVGGQGTHKVDIRIVAATNRSLAGVVGTGSFRPDLFYRLSGVDIRVPPLRERRDDVLELAQHFLDRHRTTRALRLSRAAADVLLEYDWPGNVRQLERLIERAVALSRSDVIEVEDLPDAVRTAYDEVLAPSLDRRESMRAWGSRYAKLVVNRCGGNKREACRVLEISYHTLNAYLNFRGRRKGTRHADAELGECER
jgi:transcriptional regulator with PAS, ATPase and Fis domain